MVLQISIKYSVSSSVQNLLFRPKSLSSVEVEALGSCKSSLFKLSSPFAKSVLFVAAILFFTKTVRRVSFFHLPAFLIASLFATRISPPLIMTRAVAPLLVGDGPSDESLSPITISFVDLPMTDGTLTTQLFCRSFRSWSLMFNVLYSFLAHHLYLSAHCISLSVHFLSFSAQSSSLSPLSLSTRSLFSRSLSSLSSLTVDERASTLARQCLLM